MQDQFHIPRAYPVNLLRNPVSIIVFAGVCGLFAVHTLFVLHAIDSKIEALLNSPASWQRVDMAIWCERTEAANPGFICPDPFDQERPPGYTFGAVESNQEPGS